MEEANNTYLRELHYSAIKLAPIITIQLRKYFLSGLSSQNKDILASKHYITDQLKAGGLHTG